jgi:hypothetical protein
MQLLGNLDCEARWAGIALPEAVRRRISLYGALFAACAPGEGPHEIWLPAPVDPARLLAHPGWSPPAVRTGKTPAAFDLAWADPEAKPANDRSRTLAIAQALGVALPGARIVTSLEELDDHIAGFAGRPWVCKARWTAAGRDRAHGIGGAGGALRARIRRLLERFGPLVFEPWLDRIADLGICGEIAADGQVTLVEPHRLVTDPRGQFLGIELAPAVDPAIAEPLAATGRAAARLLATQTGYRGRFAIDAFVYVDPRLDPRLDPRPDPGRSHERDSGAQHLHPLCELNARHTFGWIAHALGRRLGIQRLGFDEPPPDAIVLIAPGADRVSAWCA